MSAALELVHHCPGRLRVRSDALSQLLESEETEDRVARVRRAIGARAGVTRVSHNAHSGSILVEYEPGTLEPGALVEELARAAALELATTSADRGRVRPAADVLIDSARRANAVTETLTGGRADLRTLVPLVMAGLAACALVVRKERLPRWDNLAYWSFALFQSLHATELGRREREPPER